MFTRARLICAGLLAAALTAGALVAAPLTLGVVGDHAAPDELAGKGHTGTGTIPD
jgi:hypothetical protein